MIGDCQPSCFLRVRFGVRDGGEAALGHSPVIENARNVPHLIRPQFFDATQRKIVILRAFVAFTKTADLAERRKVARQITEKAVADAAAAQASKEQKIGEEIFLLEQKRNVSQEIVKAKLSDAELERIRLEGDRPVAFLTPVRPISNQNPAGPNPVEKPVVQSKGWEWGKATGEGFTKRT